LTIRTGGERGRVLNPPGARKKKKAITVPRTTGKKGEDLLGKGDSPC